jgi:phytoene dehydrogenase-like protein
MKAKVIVIGGGLSGLCAALCLTRRGIEVTVLERKRELGGRGASLRHGSWSVNLGGHAFYRGGAGMGIMRELGIEIPGSVPKVSGTFGSVGSGLHALPGGPMSLLSTGLLSVRGKLEIGRLMATLLLIDSSAISEEETVRAWVERMAEGDDGRAFLYALFRVSTYVDAADRLSARAAVRQLQRAVKDNVLYVDGGWSTIIERLRTSLVEHGVEIVTDLKAERIDHGEEVHGVWCSDGRFLRADAVVLAVPPSEAAELAPRSAIATWKNEVRPVRAATLDVCLRSLPEPKMRFVLGIDRPTYFSVHSRVASGLAPAGGAMIHLMRYGPEVEASDEEELEALLDRHQPSWRDHLEWRRFLPRITVTHALVEAGKRRPGPKAPDVRGLYVAGDWIGDEGMLADTALASAKLAAEMIEEELQENAGSHDRRQRLSVA